MIIVFVREGRLPHTILGDLKGDLVFRQPLPYLSRGKALGARSPSSTMAKTVSVPTSSFNMWPIFFLILKKGSPDLTRMDKASSNNDSSLSTTKHSNTLIYFAVIGPLLGTSPLRGVTPGRTISLLLRGCLSCLRQQICSQPPARWSKIYHL